MMKRLFTFLLLVIMIAGMALPCYAAEVSVDDADETIVGDVFARFVRTSTWVEIPITNGTAETTTEDGYVVSATGIPDGAIRLVVFSVPSSDAEAWNWLNTCIAEDYEIKSAFDICFEDAEGNRINANGVQVTIKRYDDECVVFSVKTNGQSSRLNSTNKDGSVSFAADGSNYYALAIKNTTTAPTEPEKPTIPTDPSSPATGDNCQVVLCWGLMILSGLMLLWLISCDICRKKKP